LEETLHSLFPDTSIVRLDTDVATKKWQSRDILDDFGAGKYQILLGTQMVAKGHHFPNVSLVGIISADIGLSLPDFRASERVEQLLTQAAGRAGRSSKKGDTGHVIIQSFAPENPLLGYLKGGNYLGFLEDELKVRLSLDYPPYKRLVLLVASSPYAHRAADGAERLRDEILSRIADKNMGILGPAESPIFKRGKLYRYQLLLKLALDQEPAELLWGLNDFMRRSKGLYIRVDIDPVSFM
jgi:primosomal protein N' (replication factor Y)